MDAGLAPSAVADVNMRIVLKRMADDVRGRGDGPMAAILEVAVRALDERITHAGAEAMAAPVRISTQPVCRSVRVGGRRTTIKLEPEFWEAVEALAKTTNCSVDAVCSIVNGLYDGGNLTSAIRVYVLRNLSQADE